MNLLVKCEACHLSTHAIPINKENYLWNPKIEMGHQETVNLNYKDGVPLKWTQLDAQLIPVY